MSDFTLTKQESIAQIFWSKNDVQKRVHCVAKNIPFVIEVGSSSINFDNKNTRLSAKLFYDSNNDEDFKPVDFLKQEPMSYKAFVTKDKATVEFRVFCLSSQHEDCCFRIKISVTGPKIETPLEVTSDPIRVVSKAAQVHKEKKTAKKVGETTEEPETPRLSGIKRERTAPSSPSSDVVQETLLRLEQQQIEQRALIERILSTQTPKPASVCAEQSQDFETAFINFLNAYRNVPCEERSNKVRKVISDSAAVNTDDLSDFIVTCASMDPSCEPLLKVPINLSQIIMEECNSSTDGESRNELAAWDSLYSELTWTPESDV